MKKMTQLTKTTSGDTSELARVCPPGSTPLDVSSPVFDAAIDALPDFEFVRDVKLLDGQGIRGTFLGWGSPAEIPDQNTGEIRTVPRALLRCHGAVYQILAGVKLAQLLGAIAVGEDVAILRLGNIDIGGGRRMTDYSVGRPRKTA